MAVWLEFIDFIVPIEVIKQKYPGGWEKCLKDHENLIGGRVWYDEHLFRDGAMNPVDIGHLVDEWQSLGFHTHDGDDNPERWVDVCAVEVIPTLPCDWIDIVDNAAFLKGTARGQVVSRETFST